MPTTRLASRSERHASIRRFSSNGSPTWTEGRLSSSPSVEPGRRQDAGAADAVTTGARAEQDDLVADAGCLAEHQPVDRQHAEAEDVDERVARIAGVEHDLTTDGRHADRVAVSRDAGHDTFGDPAAPWFVEWPEAQRVHDGDRTSAHGEDVAQDAADTGGGSLVGLDVGRMVVALDADGCRDAVTDVHDPGVLARPDEHALTLGGQTLEVEARRLVRAVLGPHHRIHGQLEVVGLAPEDRANVVELGVGQSQGLVDRRVRGSGHGPRVPAAARAPDPLGTNGETGHAP